jgi:hypothetical protein
MAARVVLEPALLMVGRLINEVFMRGCIRGVLNVDSGGRTVENDG